MAANLLAADTEDLFACGIAQSGAYNRTLTPFGFQSEQRTLWEAPNTYHNMSPFLQAGRPSIRASSEEIADMSHLLGLRKARMCELKEFTVSRHHLSSIPGRNLLHSPRILGGSLQ